MPTILVTGGAGYIGSHTAYLLSQRGFKVIILDNLSRGYADAVEAQSLREASLQDTEAITRLLRAEPVDAVVHFAAYIAVGESTQQPEMYFANNVAGTLSLLSAMREAQVKRLVFSSTAAVYGNPEFVPITEDHPKVPVNPYGETKLMVEKVLRWLDEFSSLRSVVLRYFNACGAEPNSGLGERHEPETHLIPLILRAVLTGKPVTVFGEDYDTPDGTCIRDYIHVSDLAEAHVAALNHLLQGGGSDQFNVGTGTGRSVREVIQAVEAVTGKSVPYNVGPRREGDPGLLVANSDKLQQTLGWKPRYTDLQEIIKTAWVYEQSRFLREGK